MMRVVWTIVGWAVGLGLFAALITIVIPYIANERCKERWSPLRLEGVWVFETGCMVRVGRTLIREEYVTLAPVNPTSRK